MALSNRSASGPQAVVLGQLHVSCFVTAANRATPVFDVQPERKCVRVVTKSSAHAVHSDAASASGGHVTAASAASVASTSSSVAASADTPTVEWDFHSVFVSSSSSSASAAASHAGDFFRDVTQLALRGVVLDGVNTNIVATGVHPTQKFRFLFGKPASPAATTPSAAAAAACVAPTDERDALDAHGQLGGLLFAFFRGVTTAAPHDDDDWRLGISSWIIVNNQAVDLLKPQPETTTTPTAETPLAFVTIEAADLASALRTVQTAKTHRIVRRHTAEHAHFFVRLAFFRRSSGQLSTLHLVDLTDLKDFRDDAVSAQEKLEFYQILHEIRLHTAAAAAATRAGVAASPRPKAEASTAKTMLLSNFLQPLLTQNAKTFLYANVIDSRASLRESVALLNAVANVRGFACVCKRLTGVSFAQLGFQAPPSPPPEPQEENALDSAAAKALAAVAIGESLLTRLAAGSSSASSSSASPSSCVSTLPSPASGVVSVTAAATVAAHNATPLASPVVTSDAMSWLEAFKQRKKDILASTTQLAAASAVDELPLGLGEPPAVSSAAAPVFPVPTPSGGGGGSNSSDLYARLMETIEGASASPVHPVSASAPLRTATTLASLRMQLQRSNSAPLPIEDDPAEDWLPPPPRPQPPTTSIASDLAARLAASASGMYTTTAVPPPPPPPPPPRHFQATRPVSLANMELPPQVPAVPDVSGLDAATAARIQASDAALLRRNYDALLSVVREQQQLREAAETRASEAVHDCDELRAQYEVQIENLKLEAVALKSKARALEKPTGCAQVFDQYERELLGLERELQQLRMQNVELELRLASTAAPDALQSPGMLGGGLGSLTELKKRYQAMAQDKLELEQQLTEYRRKERHFAAQSKLVHESSRKVERLSRELTEREDALVSTRLGKQQLSAEVQLAQREAQQLQHENERLLLEKAATTEELLAAKMYLASVESEQKKAAILDTFVRKHGDRMQRLQRHGGGGGGGGGGPAWVDAESWRRDAQAREAEEKLFQGVKRGVPQLVPLAAKVLRKLELQELSLREFAEREVDFTNLLVELASDQPAMALKAMIEDEMKKLSIF